jgi:putative membrane protein
VEQLFALKYMVAAVVYSLLGIVILLFSFVIFDKITPGDMWKEVVVEKNLPLAVAVGAMTLAVAHIIASAIHG